MNIYSNQVRIEANELLEESREKFNLILFSTGKLISLLGTCIYSFAVSLYILKATGSSASFAFSILIGILPRVILSPIAGSLTDRVNKRKLIVSLDFISGLVVLSLMVLCLVYGALIPFLYVTTFLLAIINTFFNTCLSAAIPKLVSDKNLVKINSYNRAIESGTSILGPVLAGMVFGFVSLNLFLLVNGISFLLSAISEMFIDFNFNKTQQEPLPEGKINLRAIGQDIKEVFHFIKSNPILSKIIPFSMTFNFLISASLAVVLPYLINNVLGMTSSQYGIVEGAFAVGMLVAALVVGRLPEKEKKRRGLVLGIIGMGLSMIIMGIPGLGFIKNLNIQITFIIYIMLAFLFAFFLISIDLPLSLVLQRTIPNHMLGRVMGVLGMITSSLSPIGIILAGVTLDIIPAYFIYFVSGIYFITAAIVLYKNKAMQEY